MIAGIVDWSGARPPHTRSVLDAVSLYERAAPQTLRKDSLFLAASARDSIGRAHGVETAFSGWIDNARELAEQLSVAPENPAALYSAALQDFGEQADKLIIGCYAAISRLPDGALRLSRSPWSAPPIYYHATAERCVASPLLRALFAADAPREPDFERMVDELAYDWRSGEEDAWYKGIRMVPLGATVTVAAAEHRTRRWYCLPPPVSEETYDEDAAVERAGELTRAIPGIRNHSAGPTVNPYATVRRYAVTVEFETLEAFRAYTAHPNHAAALAEIRPYNKAAMNAMLEV